MNSNGTNKSYQACSIILLKIDFESIIDLGGENIHLDSKVEDPIPGLFGNNFVVGKPQALNPCSLIVWTEPRTIDPCCNHTQSHTKQDPIRLILVHRFEVAVDIWVVNSHPIRRESGVAKG